MIFLAQPWGQLHTYKHEACMCGRQADDVTSPRDYPTQTSPINPHTIGTTTPSGMTLHHSSALSIQQLRKISHPNIWYWSLVIIITKGSRTTPYSSFAACYRCWISSDTAKETPLQQNIQRIWMDRFESFSKPHLCYRPIAIVSICDAFFLDYFRIY